MKKIDLVSKINTRRELLLVGLLGVILVVLLIFAPKFFTAGNLDSMAFQAPEIAFMAIGMLIVIITGGIDLSIASTAALSGIVGGLVLRAGNKAGMEDIGLIFLITISAVIVLLTSLVCGAINGFFIAILKINPTLTTLATMTLFQGVGIVISKGGSISGFPNQFYLLGGGHIVGIPIPLLVLGLAMLVMFLVLKKTAYGRRLYMIGNNEKVSLFSGVNVRGVTIIAYLWSALMAGISGLIMISRYNSAKVDHGSTYLLQVVAIVVLGGASINGGKGSVAGTGLAMLIMQFISTGLNLAGGDRYVVVVLNGVILIGMLLVNRYLDERKMLKEINEMKIR